MQKTRLQKQKFINKHHRSLQESEKSEILAIYTGKIYTRKKLYNELYLGDKTSILR